MKRDATLKRAAVSGFVESKLEELDRVSTTAPVETDGGILPAAASGTVVAVWGKGEAYEVEFTRPFRALVTLQASQVRAVHDA